MWNVLISPQNELERLVPPPLRGPSQVKGQLTPASPGSDKSPFAKITAENDRLRKELKREVAKTERLQLAVSSLELQRDQLQQQSSSSSDSLAASSKLRGREKTGAAAAAVGLEEKAERLQAELEKKTAMLMEVKTHLREAAQREREITALANNPQVPCKLHTGSSDLDIHVYLYAFQVLHNNYSRL